MRFLLCLLLVSLFRFTAIAADEYVPLAVGQESVMTASIVLPTGQTLEGTTYRKIEEAIEKDGKTYFRARTWTEGLPNKIEYTKLFRRDAQAVYSIDERVADSLEQIEMVLPIKIGNNWQQAVRGKTLTLAVTGQESVKIGDKTYENCYHIQTSSADGSFTADTWEAPVVGTVKAEISISAGVKMTFLLKEFKPGK